MNQQQRTVFGHPLWHIILVAALSAGLLVSAVIIVLTKGYYQQTFSITGSLASSLLVEKISNEELSYECSAVNEDGKSYLSISFAKLNEDTTLRFDDGILVPQLDGSWRIGTLELFQWMADHGVPMDTAELAYSFEFTAKKGEVTREGQLTGALTLKDLDNLFVVGAEETVQGNERFTRLTIPAGFEEWDISCDNPNVKKADGGMLLDDNGVLEGMNLASAGDSVGIPLQFTLKSGGRVVAIFQREIKVNTVPYLTEEIITPVVESNEFSTDYRLKINPIDRVTVKISSPLVKKVSDTEYTISGRDVLASNSGNSFNFDFNINYEYNGQVIKTKSMSLPFSRVTPLVVDKLPSTCRDNYVIVTGKVLSGATVRINKTVVKLSDNGDGTKSFRYKLAVKAKSRATAIVTAVMAGYNKNDVTVSTMGQEPANITGIPTSTDVSGFAVVMMTDPGFTIRFTYTFVESAYGMPVRKKAVVESGTFRPNVEGYWRKSLTFSSNYGKYEVSIQVLNSAKVVILSKKYTVFYETADMNADRKFIAKCKETTVVDICDDYYYDEYDLTGRKVHFYGYLYQRDGSGAYISDYSGDWSSYIYVLPVTSSADTELRSHSGWLHFYGIVTGYTYNGCPKVEIYVVRED